MLTVSRRLCQVQKVVALNFPLTDSFGKLQTNPLIGSRDAFTVAGRWELENDM